ncbi:hypothetical protein EW146_g9258 [Bondarzewia mesenterica]|uniref:Uncharacterized protein n=1 Tax=Bondarzewia mesenterica TaxID=1095465 RepID=A0A4S4L7R5_9AGAM|nr:hypothetical protein EW146_g9258 [Bondarzewia mesenterica]
MSAHPMIIAKLKDTMHNLMKSLFEAPEEPEDYIVWGNKKFVGILIHQSFRDPGWVHEAEKWELFMANKISAEEVEWNSEDEQMSLKVGSLGDHNMNTKMTVLTSETRGETSAISNIRKGKGCIEKWKTSEVVASESMVVTKWPKCATQCEPKVIPEGAIPVNNMCYYTVPVIKIELAEKKASSSSAPHLKPVAHLSGSTSVEFKMSLLGLINAEDMITWHLESNAHELIIILAECESDKHELEKVRCEVRAVKRALGIKDDE